MIFHFILSSNFSIGRLIYKIWGCLNETLKTTDEDDDEEDENKDGENEMVLWKEQLETRLAMGKVIDKI